MAEITKVVQQARDDAKSGNYNPHYSPSFGEVATGILTLGLSDAIGVTKSTGYDYKDVEKKTYDNTFNREVGKK